MHYTQLFRKMRDAKGLTLDQVASLADCHRNTVVNVESSRPVKFKTIAELMLAMGYPANSREMKSIALLWLESVSGIPFSRSTTEASAQKAISTYGSGVRAAVRRLYNAVSRDLNSEQIDLLVYAALNPPVRKIISEVRDMTTRAASDGVVTHLKVAEDK